MKEMVRWFSGSLLGVVLAGQAFGTIRDSVDAESTTKGEVATWRYVDQPGDHGFETTAEVTLNGELILREENVLGIRIAWEYPRPSNPPAQRVLLEIDQPYPRECESLYRLVDLLRRREPYVTDSFGNCHAQPVIYELGSEITFYFPPFYNRPEVAYRYSTTAGLKKILVTPEIRTRKR